MPTKHGIMILIIDQFCKIESFCLYSA